jgi:ABC-2 type transport system permease protein
MPITLSLLKPFFLTLKNRVLPGGRPSFRTTALFLFALTVIVVLYLLAVKITAYFHSQNELGVILSLKIFQMAWIILFAMQVFSCMVSSVAAIFLAQDNEIIFAAPVSGRQLFFMRYLTTSLYTSWMLMVFSLPIFAAYGKVFKVDFWYWPSMVAVVASTTFSATAFAVLVTIALVYFFPARRTKDIVMYLSLCFGILIYITFRLLRPEDLVNPDKFGQFIEYLSSISSPAAPYLPAGWAANYLSLYLLERQVDLLLLALMLITPPALYIIGEWAMGRWFLPAYTKSQESFGGFRRFGGRTESLSPVRWLCRKEALLFLRDSTEWSQLFMIAALVVVYLYNFKLLPVERSPLQKEYVTNIISFCNIGLVGFMVTSLSARFVYPCVGAEGGAFHLLRSAPISMRRYLLIKYFFYAIPFTIFALFLVILSDRLLQISGPMWWISVGASLVITWTIIALALGVGAWHADFRAESRAAAMGGFGGIVFLFTAVSYEVVVIVFGAAPAYRLVRKWLLNAAWMPKDMLLAALWTAGGLLLSIFLIWGALRQGAAKLEGSG